MFVEHRHDGLRTRGSAVSQMYLPLSSFSGSSLNVTARKATYFSTIKSTLSATKTCLHPVFVVILVTPHPFPVVGGQMSHLVLGDDVLQDLGNILEVGFILLELHPVDERCQLLHILLRTLVVTTEILGKLLKTASAYFQYDETLEDSGEGCRKPSIPLEQIKYTVGAKFYFQGPRR